MTSRSEALTFHCSPTLCLTSCGVWRVVRVGRDGVISVDGSYPVSGVSPGLLSQLDTDGRLFIGEKNSMFESGYLFLMPT